MALQQDLTSVVINAKGPTGGEVTRRELAILAQGAIPDQEGQITFNQDAPALISQPAVKPSADLMGRMRDALSRNPWVKAGYLVQMAIGGGEPHLVLGVLFSRLPEQAAVGSFMQNLGAAVQPGLAEGQGMDFMVLGDNDMSRSMQSGGNVVLSGNLEERKKSLPRRGRLFSFLILWELTTLGLIRDASIAAALEEGYLD